MEQLLGYCGIACNECPAYIALKTNDDALRAKTAAAWSKSYETQFQPEEINCAGCTEVGGHILYCEDICVIRKCALKKKVSSCADCRDYPCPPLDGFLKNVPRAKENLEKRRKGRA